MPKSGGASKKEKTSRDDGRNATDHFCFPVSIYLINIAFHFVTVCRETFCLRKVGDAIRRLIVNFFPVSLRSQLKAAFRVKSFIPPRAALVGFSPKNSFIKSPVVAYHEILQCAKGAVHACEREMHFTESRADRDVKISGTFYPVGSIINVYKSCRVCRFPDI